MILMFSKFLSEHVTFIMQAPVVRKVDSAIHWIAIYPVDSAIQLLNNRDQVSKTDHHFTLLNQVLLAARLCNLSVVV